MVTPTRIIQMNWSKTFYLLHPLPSPPPPLRKRDSRELDFALTPGVPAPACSYWMNGILHMMFFFRIKGVFNACHVLFSEIREVYDATEQANVSWEMRHPNANYND